MRSVLPRGFPRYLGVAWAVTLVAACGKIEPVQQLADAPIDEARPVKVRALSVLGTGAAETDVRVLFQDRAGAVVADVPVDIEGRAEAFLPDGGSVTVIKRISETADLKATLIDTVQDVVPGDEITLGSEQLVELAKQGGQTAMSATYQASPTATYQFFTRCATVSTNASPVQLAFQDGCLTPKFDLLAIQVDTPPRFLHATGISYAAGGSFNLPDSFIPMQSFTITARAIPEEISSITFRRSSLLGDTAVGEQISQPAGDPAAGTLVGTVPFPQNVGTRSEIEIELARADAIGIQRYQARTPTLTSSVEADLGVRELPWLASPEVDLEGARWQQLTPGASPDGMQMLLTAAWRVVEQRQLVLWRIARKYDPGVTTFPLPALPATAADVDPRQFPDAVAGQTSLSFVDYPDVEGYEELKRNATALLDPSPSNIGLLAGTAFERRHAQYVLKGR